MPYNVCEKLYIKLYSMFIILVDSAKNILNLYLCKILENIYNKHKMLLYSLLYSLSLSITIVIMSVLDSKILTRCVLFL